MHRGLDDAGRDRVDSHALLRELDGQRLGRRLQAALRERGQYRRHIAVRVVHEAGRHLHNVAAVALTQHLRDRQLRGGDKAGEVDPDQSLVVVGGVAGERLGDEDPGVVHERVDPAEVAHGGVDHVAGDDRIGDVTGYGDDAGVTGWRDRTGVGDDGPTCLLYTSDAADE